MEWISLKHEVPKDGEIVIVCDSSGIVSLAKFLWSEGTEVFHIIHLSDINNDYLITYWMSLPKPPQD